MKKTKAELISAAIEKEDRERPTMAIDTKPGTKVKFAYDDNGSENDRRDAFIFLELGYRYTVKEIKVGGWVSYVEFVENPGRTFNTVMFAPICRKRRVLHKRPSAKKGAPKKRTPKKRAPKKRTKKQLDYRAFIPG
jgi:hypothetical protein